MEIFFRAAVPAGGLLLLMYAVGNCLCRRPLFAFFQKQTGVETLVLKIASGLYVFVLVLTILGLLRMLTWAPWILGTLGLWAWNRSLPIRMPRLSRRQVWMAGGTIILLAPYWLQTLLPNTDWDSAAYHLPLGKSFLENGIWMVDPVFQNFNYPGGMSLIYSLFLQLGLESGIGIWNFSLTVLAGLYLYGFISRHAGSGVALLGPLTLASFNVLLKVSVDARTDNALLLFSLIATCSLLDWLRLRCPGQVVMAGMMAGLSLSSKYSGIAIALVLLAILLGSGVRRRELALFTFVSFLVAFPWYLRNAVELGNPIYHEILGHRVPDSKGRPVYLDQALGDPLAQASPDPDFQDILSDLRRRRLSFDDATHTFNLIDIYRHPDRYRDLGGYRLSWWFPAFFLIPLFRRDRFAWTVFAAGLMLYVTLGWRGDLIRYLMPMYFLSALAVGLIAACIRHHWIRQALLAMVLLMVGVESLREAMELRRHGELDCLSGAEITETWAAARGYNHTPGMHQVAEFLRSGIREGRIGSEDPLFMVWEAKTQDLPCPGRPDQSSIAVGWLASLIAAEFKHDRLQETLIQDHVKFILVNRNHRGWLLKNHTIEIPYLAWAIWNLDRFLTERAHCVFTQHGIDIYELAPL